MRPAILTLAGLLLIGCKDKKPPEPPVPVEEAAEGTTTTTTVSGERDDGSVSGERGGDDGAVSGERGGDDGAVSAEREPELPSNADFNATITRADGSTTEGHVRRVERSEGWYGEKGWTDKAAKITVTLEGNGTEIESEWKDIKSVTIKYGSKSDIDCQFDSEYTPIMYMCVLQSTGTVSHVDGKSWTAGNRHKWRFHFDDGAVEEFWIKKLPEREQEDGTAEIGDGSEQNYALYEKLQKQVLEKAGSTAVTQIAISP